MLYAATAAGVRGGEYYGPMYEARGKNVRKARTMPWARDRGAAARLWGISEELTGVRFDALEPVA